MWGGALGVEDARQSRCPPLSPSPSPHRRGGRGDDEELGDGCGEQEGEWERDVETAAGAGEGVAGRELLLSAQDLGRRGGRRRHGPGKGRPQARLPYRAALAPALVGLLIGCPTSTTIGFAVASSSTLRLANHQIRRRLLLLLHHVAAFSSLSSSSSRLPDTRYHEY
uniref:Uncharacterized protein n=1 Tax=Oryza meridionalis TaxID=40149 RepID=A0A0E0EIJ4_9ORYZ